MKTLKFKIMKPIFYSESVLIKLRNTFLVVLGFISFSQNSFAQWSVDSLSAPKSSLITAQVGSKAIFASSTQFETYDFATGTFALKTIITPRSLMLSAVAAGKAYFGGGVTGPYTDPVVLNKVDVYTLSTNSWTTTTLSQARRVGASGSVGDKVFFAGGKQVLTYSKRVDIIDAVTNVKTTANLSQARYLMAVGSAGNKIVFAGGETGTVGSAVSSNKVDIYDNTTGLWSVALLSQKRESISVGVVGNKILFAGGVNSNGIILNRVDIYDAATNTWSTANLSETKYAISVATVGNRVYFAGGITNSSGTLSSRVEIYDATTNTWSFITLSSPRIGMAVGQTPARLMFAGGSVAWGNTGTDRVEVLNLLTNTWSVENLVQPRLGIASASYGNKAIFAGGAQVWSSYPQYSIISKKVDIWTDLPPRIESETVTPSSIASSINIYPNPCSNYLQIQLTETAILPMRMELFDLNGSKVSEILLNDFNSSIDLNNLAAGIYLMRIGDEKNSLITKKIIKQ